MCHPDGRAQPASQLPSHCPENRRHHVHHTRDGRQTAESNQYAAARRLLIYFSAVSAGHTRYLPLALRLRAKSTTQSHRTPVYYVDITLRDGQPLPEAVAQARQEAAVELAAGVDMVQLEQSAHQALANGSFEENEEDAGAIVEEFYPVSAGPQEQRSSQVDESAFSGEPDLYASSALSSSSRSASPAALPPMSQAKAMIRPTRLTSRLGAAAANDERMNAGHPRRVDNSSKPGKSA